jgi:hypothetical protein
MGIRFSEVGRVLDHAIEKFIDITHEIWKGINQNARLYGAAGEDSPPCKEDQMILLKIDGTGKYIALAALTVSLGAKPGEKIIYARNADAAIVSKISMLNDGSVQMEADGDVTHTAQGSYNIEGEKDISVKAKENITQEAAKKNMVKGADVEISGKVKIAGGSLECNGTASPTGTGCWCAMPFCAFTGAPQTGIKAEGT